MTNTGYYTAWLTNAPSALDGTLTEVTVLPDKIVGERDGQPDRTSVGNPLFHAVTTVDARDGDEDQATREAEDLLTPAGWRLTGDWRGVTTGCTVTVERTG